MKVRNAEKSDGDAMLKLVPRLAAFDIPEHRKPRDLYGGDEQMLRDWLVDETNDCFVQVAENEDKQIVGYTLTRLRADVLSGTPSAHLEAVAVADGMEGQGVGQALLAGVEQGSAARGAKSVTLHVIATNTRAIRFYEHLGYDAELLRYIKEIE